jgi:chemotaxis signal transduction protein
MVRSIEIGRSQTGTCTRTPRRSIALPHHHSLIPHNSMAIYSPLRSRRLAARDRVEQTQRLITFKLGLETFALPLDRVHKVTTFERSYGDPNATGVSLTTYQGRELVVIDVGQRIFGRAAQILPPSPKPTISNSTDRADLQAVKYLLVLQPTPDRLVGLPIDSPPSIQSLSVSAFQPLPELYRQHSQIHCVSAFSIDTPDRPAIFLLDIAAIVSG